MSDITPEKLRAALQGATPGPWKAEDYTDSCENPCFFITPPGHFGTVARLDHSPRQPGNTAQNANLIAMAPDIAAAYLAQDNRIKELEAKLATCEKYRAAYAECDRIGTQAVRDLEAKLAGAVAECGRIGRVWHDAEAKLAKAVEALENIAYGGAYTDMQIARTTLAELKGQDDE